MLEWIQSIPMSAVWTAFAVVVAASLALDLFVFHKQAKEMAFRKALAFTAFWFSLAGAFSIFVWVRFGFEKYVEFVQGFMLEEALSVDNLFVFIVIFGYFRVPKILQHRVLFWGIFGALVLRGFFIFVGVEMVERFHWLLYIFGAFLVYTGVKLLKGKDGDDDVNPEHNPVLKLFRRFVPMVNEYHGDRFLIVREGRRLATPLMLVLVVIEATDVIFAVDSIPAVFGVSRDPFIIYTSNIFAILGLRSLYFVLAGSMGKFHYLPIGLGLVLAFIGVKMLVSGFYHMPAVVSLGVLVLLLGGSIALSILRPLPKIEESAPDSPDE